MIRRGVLGAAMVALVFTGCDTMTPEEVALNDVVRSYSAQLFMTTVGGTTTDQLARGATLTMTLSADRTTSGRLFVPGGAENGGNLDVSLAGTFSFDDARDAVAFSLPADTFLRDMTFTAGKLT